MAKYIYQQIDWPNFVWDESTLFPYISSVRYHQGKLLGKIESLGFDLGEEATLETISIDIVKTSEIEGEFLNMAEVRSSVARKLGIDYAGITHTNRRVDGVVEMMLDATQNYEFPFSKDRLCGWHNSLFPSSRSGLHKIIVGDWRDDKQGKMQVVSGSFGKEKIHFEAPAADRLEYEMNKFIDWINSENTVEPIIKSAIAHFWFVTIHPFDDGNGRIARAIAESLLTRADCTKQRAYSMSSQIMKSKSSYYDILEYTQKGNLDITSWLVWYIERLDEAIKDSNNTLSFILEKSRFWETHAKTLLNERQKKVIDKLLNNFQGKLNTSKWAKLTNVHRDTALRDIQDLIQKNILKDTGEGGRSTNYVLIIPDK